MSRLDWYKTEASVIPIVPPKLRARSINLLVRFFSRAAESLTCRGCDNGLLCVTYCRYASDLRDAEDGIVTETNDKKGQASHPSWSGVILKCEYTSTYDQSKNTACHQSYILARLLHEVAGHESSETCAN